MNLARYFLSRSTSHSHLLTVFWSALLISVSSDSDRFIYRVFFFVQDHIHLHTTNINIILVLVLYYVSPAWNNFSDAQIILEIFYHHT